MTDLESPMGNAELRLRLLSIENIATETHDQAKKTNGRVTRHDKMLWTALGGLMVLTPWAAWITYAQLHAPSPVTNVELQAAVDQAFANNLRN